MKRTKQNDDNFIMLPTVDFCFKELMRNPKVRKGFIAAVLGKKPEEIRDTTLIPTELRKESEDDKLGILDVLVELADETKMNMELQVSYFECWINRVLFYLSKIYSGQIREGEEYDRLHRCIHVGILDFIHFSQDKKCFRKLAFCDVETGEQYTDLMEMYVLELKKLPPEDLNEKGIIRWMRFLGGKNREEFEDMAKKDEYIEEAYNELKKLSHDEQMRMEYELRQKAIRDHNMMMKTVRKHGYESGYESGYEAGEKQGYEAGEKQGYEMGERLAMKKVIDKLTGEGRTIEETAELLGLEPEMVEEISKAD